MTWDTARVDGVDLSSLGLRIIRVFDGIYTSASESGDPEPIAGRDGAEDVPHDFTPTVVTLGLQLRGGVLTGFNDMLRALTRVVKPGQLTTLERRLSYATGNESHTCRARYLTGLTPTKPTPGLGQFGLSWLNLDGVWYGAQITTTPSPTRNIEGDTRTRRITIVTTGSGTLTNVTTGAVLVITGAVTIDVENQTSTGAIPTHSGDDAGNWWSLIPGLNNITWAGTGTPQIKYNPAYP